MMEFFKNHVHTAIVIAVICLLSCCTFGRLSKMQNDISEIKTHLTVIRTVLMISDPELKK